MIMNANDSSVNPTFLYDLSDGWTRAVEKQPEIGADIWVWQLGSSLRPRAAVNRDFPLNSDWVWKPMNYPPAPRRRTPDELERDAILDAWKKQGIDYAYDQLVDVPNNYLLGWRNGRDWVRAQKGEK